MSKEIDEFSSCSGSLPDTNGSDASHLASGDLGGGSSGQRAAPITYRVTVLPPAGRAEMLPDNRKSATFDCGCAWNGDRFVMLNPYVEMGDTVVPRPPSAFCPVCQGGGKTSERRHYQEIRRDTGATAGDGKGSHSERQRYYRARRDEDDFLTEKGWQVQTHDWKGSGGSPGRPKSTTPNMDVTKLYVTHVVNELVDRNAWMLALNDDDFRAALGVLTLMVFALTTKANARDMATWLGISKSTVYNHRKRGKMFLQQLAEMDAKLDRMEAKLDDLHWSQMFKSDGQEEPEDEQKLEAWTKP